MTSDMEIKSIELGCAPGYIRPGDLIHGVIKGTILEKQLKDPVSKFFGNWTWIFYVSNEEWEKVQKITKPRIEELYNSGTIRYGSW